jgi:hypothetical protein
MALTEREELELLELEEQEALSRGGVPTRDGMTREEFSAEFRTQIPAEAMQADPSFLQRVGEDLEGRGAEIGRIWGGAYPEQALASDVFQTVGQVAGGGVDIAGETVGTALSAVTPDVIEDPVKRYLGIGGEAAVDAAARSPLVQRGVEMATEFAEAYPETARNLAAAGNIVMAAPAAKPIGKGLKATKQALKKQKPVELSDLASAEDEAWGAVRDIAEKSGTTIKGAPVRNRFDFAIKKRAKDLDYGPIDPDVHPQTAALVTKLNERLDVDSITPEDLQRTRTVFDTYYNRSLGDMGKTTPDTRYITEIKSAFDDIVDGIDAKDLNKGSLAFNEAYKDARKISSVKRKTQVLDKIYRDAELNARNSSFEVALKNGFRNLAKNDKKMRQFNKAEQKLIRNAAKTGKVEALANKFAVFSPTAGRLGAALTGGAGVGAAVGASNPALLALPAVGFGAEALAARQARKGAQRAFSGVAEQLNPRQSLTERARAAVGRKVGNQKGAIGVADDLPMDQASRMQRAREMGFDVDNPVYHGTPSATFDKFKPDQFFTSDPNYANRFTSSGTSSSSFYGVSDDAPAVIPAYVKTKKVFDTRKPEHAKILKDKFAGKFGEGVLTEKGLPDWVEGRDIAEFLRDELPEMGFDSLIVDEGIDAAGARPIAKIVFDPKNIRSVNAKFDPKKKNSANLLAGTAGAAVIAGEEE